MGREQTSRRGGRSQSVVVHAFYLKLFIFNVYENSPTYMYVYYVSVPGILGDQKSVDFLGAAGSL